MRTRTGGRDRGRSCECLIFATSINGTVFFSLPFLFVDSGDERRYPLVNAAIDRSAVLQAVKSLRTLRTSSLLTVDVNSMYRAPSRH